MCSIRPMLLALLGMMFAAQAAYADAALQNFVEQTLVAAREKDHLPAIAALVQIDGKIEAETAIGIRAIGRPEAVTTSDRWAIGSDTKAFTATMIARLVEQGIMRFDDTLATSFPALAKAMNPAYRNNTVVQLLSHTAGLPALTDDKDLPAFMAAIASADGVQAQRAAIARKYLTMPPASKAGAFAYSNLGFIIAGAIAEARTGKAWEDLIRVQIFAPLGIVNGGFGVPGASATFDQPRGHVDKDGKRVALDPADPDADNPAALGPAGTINNLSQAPYPGDGEVCAGTGREAWARRRAVAAHSYRQQRFLGRRYPDHAETRHDFPGRHERRRRSRQCGDRRCRQTAERAAEAV